MTTYRDENSTIGDTTIWNYDVGSGLVTNKVYANGTGPSYQYSTTGNLLRRTWARGVAAEYSYDGWNNLISIDYSDDTTDVAITYDALGRKTSVVDAAGSTAFAYDDEFGDLVTETWGGLGDRALTRYRDTFGRDTGYSVNGSRKTIITYDSATGRISGLDAGGQFTWEYLEGTDLKSRVNYPNGLEVNYEYESSRDLLIGITNSLEDTVFSGYAYTNDATGRRVSKNDEQYVYNLRDELVSASSTNNVYSYVYDDIGNRITSSENGESKAYVANNLNQYSSITDAVDTFVPQFDADGNETLIRTSTGVWQVEYNGENRPVRWTRGNTVVTMDFDLMGRRTFYRETENGDQVKFARFFYDDYLMIQELCSSAPYDVHREFIWDPTSSVATKPLRFSQNGNDSVYMTHDGNKNVSDLVRIAPYNDLVGRYDYAPFGAVRFQVGDYALDNPYRFSSEYFDDTLGLSYYNYRHYEPIAGRWINRDSLSEIGEITISKYAYRLVINTSSENQSSDNNCFVNGCIFCHNNAQTSSDYLGKCECINDLLLSAPWNDYHGNYCGAKRVNGNLSPNGQDGTSPDEIGTKEPADEFDRCCLKHDKCLAKIEKDTSLSPSGRNLAIKTCDLEIAGCWLRAQFTAKEVSCWTRVKGALGAIVMPVCAHILNPVPMEQDDGSVVIGVCGFSF